MLKPSGVATLPDGGPGFTVSEAEKRAEVARFLERLTRLGVRQHRHGSGDAARDARTPARISTSPATAASVIASSRKTAP